MVNSGYRTRYPLVTGASSAIPEQGLRAEAFAQSLTPHLNPSPPASPPSTAPRLHSIGVGCGGNRRGGIGTEQQGIEPGFDGGEPFVLLLQPLDIVLDQLRSLLALECSDLGVDGWMPV